MIISCTYKLTNNRLGLENDDSQKSKFQYKILDEIINVSRVNKITLLEYDYKSIDWFEAHINIKYQTNTNPLGSEVASISDIIKNTKDKLEEIKLEGTAISTSKHTVSDDDYFARNEVIEQLKKLFKQ